MNDNKLQTLIIWWQAARPKTLPASIAPVAIGGALARHDGSFDGLTFLLILACALAIQIATNFANDALDFERGADAADRLGPQRATQSGLLASSTVKSAAGLSLSAALIIGVYLVSIGGIPILTIGVLSLICAVWYTAGPYALAYTGLGDLFVLIFFGPVAVGGTYYLLTGTITSWVIFAGLAPGMISTAILAVNNLRDIETDRRANKRTLAVRFGARFARREYIVLLACAAAVPALLGLSQRFPAQSALASLYLIPALSINRIVQQSEGRALNAALEKTGKLLLLFSLLFVFGIW